MAEHMVKAFWAGVVSTILTMLSGGLALLPAFIVMSLIALGANAFAAYAINRARLVTDRFPVTHQARFGRARGDVTAGFLAFVSLMAVGLWVTHFVE